MSIDSIQKEMLLGIPDSYQKTVGFPTYDITRAHAIGCALVEEELALARQKMFLENMTGEELDKYAAQVKGLVRRPATHAVGTLEVTGTGTIPQGALFATQGGVLFMATETTAISGSGTIAIQAVEPGSGGNMPAESITSMPVTIPGIAAVRNPSPTVDGYEEETDGDFRERLEIALREPPTSGNIAHYKSWALEISGVGGVKVFPLARGDNTVDVVIIDSQGMPASEGLVTQVQDHIDPGSTGKGEGQAPIGARCYVESATALPITLEVTITPMEGQLEETIKEHIQNAVTAYLKEIAFQQDYVSYGKIAVAINDAQGVLDYADLTLNGGTGNLEVPERQVANLGEVTVHVAG